MTGPLPPPAPDNRQQQLEQASIKLGGKPAPRKKKAPPAPPPPPPVVQSVDENSLTQAKAKAAASGLPQPVRAPDGHIVYYVDWTGGVIPDTLAAEQLHAAGQRFLPSDQSKDPATVRARLEQQQAEATAQYNTQKAGGNKALKAANDEVGYVWVNGERKLITGFDAKGNPIVGWQNADGTMLKDKNGKPVTTQNAPPGDTSVFDAIPNNTALDSAPIFNLGSGETSIWTGAHQGGVYGDVQPNSTFGGDNNTGQFTPDHPGNTNFAAAEHGYQANTVSNGRTRMTVGEGVQWFLDLSQNHPAEYEELVRQLVAAHYLTPALGEASGGGFSNDAAAAFARATMDLAQVNNHSTNGRMVALPDFLDRKAKAAQKAAADSTQPVTREFEDPATLHYAARQAAQQLLGRNLTPSEQAAFDASFHGQENHYYNDLDATQRAQAAAGVMQQAGPANTATKPDATGEANDYVMGDQFTSQREGYSMVEYLKAFHSLLTGGL